MKILNWLSKNYATIRGKDTDETGYLYAVVGPNVQRVSVPWVQDNHYNSRVIFRRGAICSNREDRGASGNADWNHLK